jgi:type I restriction enzyme S subunit
MSDQHAKRKLPAGWRWVRLREVIREAQGGFASGERDTSGVIQLRMNNVTNRGQFDWSSFIRVPADSAITAVYRLQPEDVLFNNTNSTDLVGKTALFKGYDEPVVFSNHFTRLRTIPELLAPNFLALWLQAQWQQRLFANICNRWIGQSAVQRDKLLALEIPLPPLSEQQRIAAILAEQLAAVDRARAAAKARLEAAKALPAAYLRAVFNSPEAQQWPRKRLEEVGDIVSGVTLGRKLNGALTRSIPYLRVANVKDGYLDLSDIYQLEATEAEIEKCQLKWGDLLLTEGGDPDKLGRGTFWEEQISECIHQNHIFRVRFDLTEFSPQFISAQVSSSYGKAYFLAHAKQTTGIATINQKVLAAFPLMTPPLPTQKRIAVHLSEQIAAVERASKALEEELAAINALPAALLREAFAGRL